MSSMVILVMHDTTKLDDVLERWHDAGAPAVTMFDAVGTRGPTEQGRRDDLPLMPSIRALLQSDDAPRKVVFSVVPDEVVDALVDVTVGLIGDLSEPGKGILFAVPLSRVVGLRVGPHTPD